MDLFAMEDSESPFSRWKRELRIGTVREQGEGMMPWIAKTGSVVARGQVEEEACYSLAKKLGVAWPPSLYFQQKKEGTK